MSSWATFTRLTRATSEKTAHIHITPSTCINHINTTGLAPVDGFLFLDREKFAESFAADLPAADAAFMADSQVPWGVEALNGTISDPPWRSKPSWNLIATDDRRIPPPAQRARSERAGSTVAEQAGSHSIYVSQPRATAELIKQAARRALIETPLTVG